MLESRQVNPDRSDINGIAEHTAHRSKKVPLHFCFTPIFQKSGGEKQTECFCHLRNIQDKLADRKSPKERRFGTPFDGPVMPFGVVFLYEKHKSSSSIWYKDASRNIHRIRAEFWRRLDRRLHHRGLARH